MIDLTEAYAGLVDSSYVDMWIENSLHQYFDEQGYFDEYDEDEVQDVIEKLTKKIYDRVHRRMMRSGVQQFKVSVGDIMRDLDWDDSWKFEKVLVLLIPSGDYVLIFMQIEE